MVNRQLCTASLALILCFPLLAHGQSATKAAPPQPDAAMPKIDFNDVPLDEALKILNEARPSFQVVLASGARNYPNVTLHLREVTPEQVLRVLQKQLGLGVEPAGTPPIYVVSVPPVDTNPPTPKFRVTAYCLTPIIDQLIQARDTRGGQNPTTQPAAEQARKQRTAVMNDVINVVQSAVNIAPDQVTATILEVNEPTETLVIKGTPEQRDAAESVLRALEPRPGMVVRGEAPQRGGGNRQ
jgi:hypothetical protein